jgi:hypothetical protein
LISVPSNATQVALSSGNDAQGSAAISSQEVDYYSFTPKVSGTYRLSTTTPGSNLDTVIGVFNGSGVRLAYNDDVGYWNTDSQRSLALVAGQRYYLGVTNYTSSPIGSYTWRIDGPQGVAAGPDLQGAKVQATDRSPWGEAITVQSTVRNAGNAASGSFQTQWWLSRDTSWSSDDIILTELNGNPARTISGLAAGATSSTTSVTLALPPASYVSNWSGSTFYIVMRTDSAYQVAELNEANNTGQIGRGLDYDPITIGTTFTTNNTSSTNGTNTAAVGGFQITLNVSGMTASQRNIFDQAAQRWSQVIVGDLPNATYAGRTVDDLLIDARGASIDGVGGVLGQAGPDALRSGSYLPIHGMMEFDTADLASMEANGTLLGVVMHEMGHVLGIGTIWDNLGLVRGAGTSDPRFQGSRAVAEYNRIFRVSASSVPLENSGGAGTRDSHWEESIFDNEIMTGYVESAGVAMPISRITAASLADIGYQVNMNAADPYSRPSGISTAMLTSSSESTSSNQVRSSVDALFAQWGDLANSSRTESRSRRPTSFVPLLGNGDLITA